MTATASKAPWVHPSDAPVIEQSIHDYIVSIFRASHTREPAEIIPISPGAEATRGWDAAVIEIVPLYFQYKLPDFTHFPERTQNAAFLARQQWGFYDADGLFHFNLREKARSAPRSQHALLVDMEAQGDRVFYVAPTFIDFTRLRFGGKLVRGRTWYESYIDIAMLGLIERIDAPLLDGLICIPPYADVDGSPEDHKFCFNANRQVSLHSDPEEVDAQDLSQVLRDQISMLLRQEERVAGPGARAIVNSENYSQYTTRVLQTLSGGDGRESLYSSVRQYFESKLARGEIASRNPMMRNLRALAKVVKKLAGLDMLLTLRRSV